MNHFEYMHFEIVNFSDNKVHSNEINLLKKWIKKIHLKKNGEKLQKNLFDHFKAKMKNLKYF